MRLRVGQDLLGDPLPRDPALINQFVVEDAAGRKPVVGRDGADPAGFVRVAAPGLLVIGYRSNPSAVELTAEKFNQYLKEEGLDAVAALRARRNETGARPASSSRAARRAWCFRDRRATTQGDRPLGFTLELVAERNPYAIRAGQDLPVRLTYENRPLAGALVVAMNRLNPSEKLTARTDSDGRVRFRLPPRRDVADQGRPHGSGAGRRQRRVGQLLGVAHVRARRADGCRKHLMRPQDKRIDRTGAAGSSRWLWLRRAAVCAVVCVLACAARSSARTRSARRACRSSFDEGRTYDIEIVTDAAALVEKLEAVGGPQAPPCRRLESGSVSSRLARRASTRRFAGE